jgi:hypothetical protein
MAQRIAAIIVKNDYRGIIEMRRSCDPALPQHFTSTEFAETACPSRENRITP